VTDVSIETITGRKFDYTKPTFDAGEIAHALGMQCRFTGHSRQFFSEAEHSVLVSRIIEDLRLGDPMEGLFCVATRAYLAGIPPSLKSLLADYQKVENALDRLLRKELALPEEETPGCLKAGQLALFIEARELMPSKGRDWEPAAVREEAWQLPYMVNRWTPDNATSHFMSRMADVRRRLRGRR
jgi:hypothetical protein